MLRRTCSAAIFTTAIALLASSCLVTDVAALSLRSGSETWRLLSGQTTEQDPSATPAPQPVQEKSLVWIQDSTTNSNTNANDSASYHTAPLGKISGDQAIVVFHDRTLNDQTKAEAALVSFDVRSNANCVVSVCGTSRNWYMASSEQCWGLMIAPKSTNANENGLIRGISAAYTAMRPVANKMYLKFDAVNYIDGSACHYEVLTGTKTVTTEAVAVPE